MTQSETVAVNAADAFTASAAKIARTLIADGVPAEHAAATAVEWLLRKMVTERPTLLVKVAAAAVVKMQAGV